MFHVSTRLNFFDRYNSITRFNSDLSRSARPRRKPTETQLYHFRRKSDSASSSSSASPSSPPMVLPSLTSFQPILENNEPPYQFDTFSWSSSSSVASEDLSFRSSPNSYEYMQENNNASNSSSPPSIEPGYQSFDISMNPTLSFSQSPTASGLHSQNSLYKSFTNHNHIHDQTYSGYSQFPLIQANDDSNHFAIFGGLSQTPIDPTSSVIGMH